MFHKVTPFYIIVASRNSDGTLSSPMIETYYFEVEKCGQTLEDAQLWAEGLIEHKNRIRLASEDFRELQYVSL